MRHPTDERLRGFSRVMRKEATNADRRMWSKLRDGRLNGLKFRRQVPIGDAIADFVCYQHKLIIEVDGEQHSDRARHVRRDAELTRRGFRILRFWNIDVMRNTRSVLDTILAAADTAEESE
jgi:very-short-patch-repair endonuclease